LFAFIKPDGGDSDLGGVVGCGPFKIAGMVRAFFNGCGGVFSNASLEDALSMSSGGGVSGLARLGFGKEDGITTLT